MTSQRRFQNSGMSDNLDSGPVPEGVISRLRATDGDWKDYTDALRNLTDIATLVRKRRPYSPDENKALLQQIRLLAPSFALFIGDLRSSLVKEVCHTISSLSEIFGASFVAQIDVQVIPALLKRTCTSKAVIRETAKSTAVSLFKHGLPAISNPVAVLLRDTIRNRKAAPGMRQAASQFVGMFLVEPTSAPSPSILSALEESILAGVEDPDETVRSQSRDNWLLLAALDEPTAAALLERMSFRVVPHLEESFEDEFGRPLTRGEETVTQTLPLTAFDRPVRSGQANPIRRRPGPVRASVQSNLMPYATNALTKGHGGGFQEVNEESSAPVRARIRSSTLAHSDENVTGDNDSRNVSSTPIPAKLLVGSESAVTSPPVNQLDHQRSSIRPVRVGLPSGMVDVNPPARPTTISSYSRVQNPLPSARTYNGSQPVRVYNGSLPIRAQSAAPPTRVQSGPPPIRASGTTATRNNSLAERTQDNSLSTRTIHTSSLDGIVSRDCPPQKVPGFDGTRVPHEPRPMCPHGVSSTLVTKPTGEQGFIALTAVNADTSKNVSEQTRQDHDSSNSLVLQNATSPELSSKNLALCEPPADAASSDVNDLDGSSQTPSTVKVTNDGTVPFPSSKPNDYSRYPQCASSSLSDSASQFSQGVIGSKKGEQSGLESRASCPAILSPQQSSGIVLNKGRLSFILGVNITPRKTTASQWTRSLFDLTNPDHFSSPESMGRLSGEVGLSVALGDRTGPLHIASTARDKRGISVPDLDSDIDCSPAPPTKNGVLARTGTGRPVENALADSILKTEKRSVEDGLDSSTISTAQENTDMRRNCESDIDACKETTTIASDSSKSLSLTGKERGNSKSCNEKSENASAPKTIKLQAPRIFGREVSGTKLKSVCTADKSDSRHQQSMEAKKNDLTSTADRRLNGEKLDAAKSTKDIISEVTSDTWRSRRATAAPGAPVLGKDRLTTKAYMNNNPTREALSHRPARHSVMPTPATRNKKPVSISATMRMSTQTANGGVTSSNDRVDTRVARATLSTRLPRSVVTTAAQKVLESCPSKKVTAAPDENKGVSRSLETLKANSDTCVSSMHSQRARVSSMAIARVSMRDAPSESQNPSTGAEKLLTSGVSRMMRVQSNGAASEKAGKGIRRETKSRRPTNMRTASDLKKREETPSEQLHLAVRKLRSVAGRGRGDWSSRLERMKDMKEALQTIDRDYLNAKVTEDCVLVISDMVNDGHHRVVVAALDSLFLLLLRVEGDAESGALQRVLERKADVLRKVLHLCKDTKEDIRLACQRVLQSFEVQFAPEVQVGLLLRAMGIETGRGGRGRKSSVRIGHSNPTAAVGSEVRVLECGCRSLVKAYERAERCEGGFVWSPTMLEMILVGMAKLSKDKHVEIRRGADGVVKAVQSSLPDVAFDLACNKYGVKFACVESGGNDGTDGDVEGK